jgi:hypothetical protein
MGKRRAHPVPKPKPHAQIFTTHVSTILGIWGQGIETSSVNVIEKKGTKPELKVGFSFMEARKS